MPKILRRVGANFSIMQKTMITLLMLLFSFNTFGQELWKYATPEETEFSEESRDEAYLAPNSRFIGKKWYLEVNQYFIFNSNGTFKWIGNVVNNNYGSEVKLTVILPGTWKRNKSFITLSTNYKQSTINIDQSSLSKLSARKRDECKRGIKQAADENRRMPSDTTTYEIYKLNRDYFFLYNTTGNFIFYSEKMKNEIEKRIPKE